MGALDQPFMLTENLPFCGHDKPIGVDPEADRPVGEGGRHAIAVALKADQAVRLHAFQGDKGGGLHHAGFYAQLALGQSFLLPKKGWTGMLPE